MLQLCLKLCSYVNPITLGIYEDEFRIKNGWGMSSAIKCESRDIFSPLRFWQGVLLIKFLAPDEDYCKNWQKLRRLICELGRSPGPGGAEEELGPLDRGGLITSGLDLVNNAQFRDEVRKTLNIDNYLQSLLLLFLVVMCILIKHLHKLLWFRFSNHYWSLISSQIVSIICLINIQSNKYIF